MSPYRRDSSRGSSPRRMPPHDHRSSSHNGSSSGFQIRGLARSPNERHPQDDFHDDGRNSRDDYYHDRRRREETYRPHDDYELHYDDRPHHLEHDSTRTAPSRSRSPLPRGRDGFRDRDREQYHYRSSSRSPPRRERSPRRSSPYRNHRGSSPLRNSDGFSLDAAPNHEVAMRDLPLNITEKQVDTQLKTRYGVKTISEIRLVRDRTTDISKGFGFVVFPTIEDATDFVKTNWPVIHLHASNSESESQSASVRIAFARQKGGITRRNDLEWECTQATITADVWIATAAMHRKVVRTNIDASELGLTATDPTIETEPVPVQAANVGDSDAAVGSTPSQYLLVRSLHPSVNEELFAKGAAKLLRPDENPSHEGNASSHKITSTSAVAHAGARPDSIRRILLVKDRSTDKSWGYGFVEFATVEDAQAALAKSNSLEKFTISSRPVMVSYVHAGVFVPAKPQIQDSGEVETFSFSSLTNPSLHLEYWDQAAYARELVVSTPETVKRKNSGTSSERNERLSKVAKDDISDKKAKKRKLDDPSTHPSADSASNKKALPAHLQMWTNRFNELHGKGQKKGSPSSGSGDATEALSTSDTAANMTVENDSSTINPQPAPYNPSFGDPKKLCCYLCLRQFQAAETLYKHERESGLHLSNLENPELVAKARAKLTELGITPIEVSGGNQSATSKQQQDKQDSEYRDRARERRQHFHQPKQPAPVTTAAAAEMNPNPSAPISFSLSTSTTKTATSGTTTPPQTATTNPSNPPQSKGASMLTKLGWDPNSGRGLGAASSSGGITAPITTDAYAAGVGLGAAGGKLGDAVEEAARNSKGDYAEFAKRTREKARERYEGMK